MRLPPQYHSGFRLVELFTADLTTEKKEEVPKIHSLEQTPPSLTLKFLQRYSCKRPRIELLLGTSLVSFLLSSVVDCI